MAFEGEFSGRGRDGFMFQATLGIICQGDALGVCAFHRAFDLEFFIVGAAMQKHGCDK